MTLPHPLTGTHTHTHTHILHPQATIVPRGHALGMVSQVPDKDEYSITRQQLLADIDVCMGGKAAEELIFGGRPPGDALACPAFYVSLRSRAQRGLERSKEAARAMPVCAALGRPAPSSPPFPPHPSQPVRAGEDHVTTGATSDLQQATRKARHMVVDCGMSERIGPGAAAGPASAPREPRRLQRCRRRAQPFSGCVAPATQGVLQPLAAPVRRRLPLSSGSLQWLWGRSRAPRRGRWWTPRSSPY